MKRMTQNIVFLLVIFKKINIPQFNLVSRSQYGNGCDFKHEVIEYQGNKCFIPTKGYCFAKCNNFLTGEGYKTTISRFYQKRKKKNKSYD